MEDMPRSLCKIEIFGLKVCPSDTVLGSTHHIGAQIVDQHTSQTRVRSVP